MKNSYNKLAVSTWAQMQTISISHTLCKDTWNETGSSNKVLEQYRWKQSTKIEDSKAEISGDKLGSTKYVAADNSQLKEVM